MPPPMPERAIVDPSGDHAGWARAVTPSTATRRSMRPVSTFQMASSLSPFANVTNANCRPSGDHVPAELMKRMASKCASRPDELSFLMMVPVAASAT